MEQIEMTTLVEILEDLRLKKIDTEFRMENNKFTDGKSKTYIPDELSIIKTYRFEGESNPDDSAILYLIQANDGLMGYSINAYGAFSNQEDGYDNFIKQVKVKELKW